MKIRKAEARDIEAIYSCFLELAEVEDKASKKVDDFLMDTRSKRKDLKTSGKKELLREIKEKNSLYLVAEQNKEIVGYIYGSIKSKKDPFFESVKKGHLNALVIKEKFRGQGIAKLLNEELEKWFKKNECRIIYLEVFSENPAKELYPKWGYKTQHLTMVKKL